jgi:peptidyl-prolyl cis-trans isomerase SurA
MMSLNCRKMVSILLLSALMHSGFVSAQNTPATTTIDSIVAIVDSEVILSSELALAVSNIKKQYASQAGQLPPDNILERQVLDRLILQRLQINRAKEIGIRVSDAELTQTIQSIAASNKLTVEQFQQRIEKEGISFQEYSNNLRDEMLQQRLRQSYIQSRVQVSENEVEQMISSQEAAGPEVLLANILVALPEGATTDQIATAKGKIDGILGLLNKGQMTFKAAAIRYSDAQNALEGGEIGWRSLESIPPQFSAMINGMKPGDVSEPVRGPSGYQLIQLVDVRDAQSARQVDEFKVEAILIDPAVVGGDEVARQRADDLRSRVIKGEDFAKLAKEFSSKDLNADNGGVLDWFTQNQWGAKIGAQVVLLKTGDVSPVIKTDAGYAFMKLLGKRSTDANAENKRNAAREKIGQRKAEEEYERFLRQLRSEAFVETRLSSA